MLYIYIYIYIYIYYTDVAALQQRLHLSCRTLLPRTV